jgi:myosin-5
MKLAYLEKLRSERLRECVVIIQKNYRRFANRKRFIKLRSAVITLQKNMRSWLYRTKYQRQREEKAAILLQKYVRGWLARRKFHCIKMAVVKIQSCKFLLDNPKFLK